ncbi:conserved hypothetical protein [Pirellula staleyi DSM 6068]|uniref:Calcineurin-like phosphoesterase domain-containing protein n=1 Tax=Pirellula staleyi (strain ATCC 27377 / DSM 6068 / ICPB 4128) TaxID=530564 RepID=D2R0B5_PIRSD|nr:metallophosphoesterase [Pirellula staleyi]ADB14783.1 conserved hypothetical protein [Pirellula staleyi DSM 6068]
MPDTVFVSDLHLYSARSQPVRFELPMHQCAAEVQTMVLGGDIFDFRWSTLGDTDATIVAAMRWLDDLVASHAQCQFHFVLGNHDYNEKFVTELERYALQRSNLDIHHYWLRLDQNIFLHGDAADHPAMCADRLIARRDKWRHDESRTRLHHAMYDLAVRANLHKLASHVMNRPQKVVGRIHQYLRRIGQGPDQGVEQVYFGHTHAAINALVYDGMTFHNGGAPITGLDFRIVDVAS